MLCHVALVRTDVSEELSASFIRVHHRFLQEPRSVTSQKKPFSIVTAMKTSNLTLNFCLGVTTVMCNGMLNYWYVVINFTHVYFLLKCVISV
jgi:hypothetical protein